MVPRRCGRTPAGRFRSWPVAAQRRRPTRAACRPSDGLPGGGLHRGKSCGPGRRRRRRVAHARSCRRPAAKWRTSAPAARR
eukprot:scaffold4075_cov299-Prasinococcus_capsulatus_cf.AAC.3